LLRELVSMLDTKVKITEVAPTQSALIEFRSKPTI
jgi:hypothetical protein